MTLAQATLALGTCSPLLRLAVYRPSMEDGMYICVCLYVCVCVCVCVCASSVHENTHYTV